MDEELGAVGLEELDRFLGNFHVGDGLPLVHGDEPLAVLFSLGSLGSLHAATAEVDDQLGLVAVQGGEDGVEVRLGEFAVGEEVGGYDDLM